MNNTIRRHPRTAAEAFKHLDPTYATAWEGHHKEEKLSWIIKLAAWICLVISLLPWVGSILFAMT